MGSVSSYFSLLTVLSVFAALFAIIYQGYLASLDLRSLTDILKNLNHLEFAVQVSKPRVAIGYGSCSDLYVKAVDFLNFTEALQRSLDQTTPFNVDDITTEDEFLQSFAYYFQRGAAAEYNFFNQSPRGFFYPNLVFQEVHRQQGAIPEAGSAGEKAPGGRTAMGTGRQRTGHWVPSGFGRRGSGARSEDVVQVSMEYNKENEKGNNYFMILV